MASVRLDIRSDMGKAEEIEILRKLAVAIERAGDTYLSSLFREELIDWVQTQINGDFPPDLWRAYAGLRDDVVRLERGREDLANAVEVRLQAVKRALRRSVVRIRKMGHRERRLSRSIDFHNAELRTERKRVNDECAQKLNLQKELDEANEEKARLERELIRLKAGMYDLIEKYEGGVESEIGKTVLASTMAGAK